MTDTCPNCDSDEFTTKNEIVHYFGGNVRPQIMNINTCKKCSYQWKGSLRC
jgi:RNA polymerase subunit RPABC4/transcription elongation factor Spt4